MTKTKSLNKEIEKVQAFIDYYNHKENRQFNNAFDKLNFGETSITDLLAWLLDTNWVNNEPYNKLEEDQIHREFTFKFLNLLKNAETENNKSILQNLDNKQLHELANGIEAKTNENTIDIFLINKEKKFVCVIENKKRAKLSCSKNHSLLQIEKYHNYIEEKYSDYYKKFVYLCAEKEDTEKHLLERLSDVNTTAEDIQKNLVFLGKRYNELEQDEEMTIKFALESLNYTIIEHSDVVMILYKILLNRCRCKFDENGILKSTDESETIRIAARMLNLYRTVKKDKTALESKISGNAKMRFYENFRENYSYKERLDILCQYVEYWELHNGEYSMGDYLYGYTKIVDGEYIWLTCIKLKENQEDWKKVRKMAKNCNELKKYVEEIDKKF